MKICLTDSTTPFALVSVPRKLCALILLIAMVWSPAWAEQTGAVAISGGTVLTMDGKQLDGGTVVFVDGKLTAVGMNARIPTGAEVIDATGKYVMPGLVDAMTSVGVEGLNESVDPMTPHLQVIDGWYPYGQFGSGKPGPIRLNEPLSGGVTTQYIGPGDNTLIGGLGAVVKTAGDSIAAVRLVDRAAMDMTLGEPPKKTAVSKQADPFTRMAQVAMLRQLFIQAQEHQRSAADNPDLPRNLKMEALGELLDGAFPARIQANRDIDIRAALALADEFGFRLIIDSGASAIRFSDQLASQGIPVVMGQVTHPYVSNDEAPDVEEYADTDERNAARLTAAGVKIALASFARAFGTLAPAGTSKWLLIDASTAGGYGMAQDDILKAVTINAAEILGVDDRVGSLSVGKDADVIILDGHPLSIRTWVERVYVSGELVFERE
jgi:imidazolonepropionase-like amidohydrolase